MPKPHDDTVRQMQERIQNVLTTLNKYRAQNLEDRRIEAVMTQLEDIAHKLEEGESFSYQELRELDFTLIEGTPLETNESLARELYSIRNFVEHLP